MSLIEGEASVRKIASYLSPPFSKEPACVPSPGIPNSQLHMITWKWLSKGV